MEVYISVRNLVEFILRSGDIDNRRKTAPDNAMQEGGRIHRMLQRRMGAEYHAEVALRYVYDTGKYAIVLEGRADGIIISSGGDTYDMPALKDETLAPEIRDTISVTIDEIKGTYRELDRIREAVPVHLAQAKCYAAIYGNQNHLRSVRVRITYCNIDTEEVKYFHYDYEMQELADWFEELLRSYRKWADFEFEWKKLRQASIKELPFPFDYREGQKDLVKYVYQTIYHRKKLFIEAPTGVGKTISTLFPAVKAMGEEMGQKIFYLTAKTITRTVADDALEIMRRKGLKFKSVILTAKDKICFMDETECNPVYCPFAKGHFDRINDAIYDLLTTSDNFNRETIEDYAGKHQVCPFEMCLDMSLFADAVICDYNYLFDPHVYLRRFFTEGVREDYLFLIDEAHNLVERGRDMYSAELRKEDFLALKKTVKDYDGRIYSRLERCNREMLELKRECEDYLLLSEGRIADLVKGLNRLSAAIEDYLEDHEDSPVRKEILDFYFTVSHFLLIQEKLDKGYEIYCRLDEEGGFIVRLFCVDPSRNLRECMMRGRSTILFSATLLPIGYYKALLGAEEGDYEVYAKSVFLPERRGLFIASDVTSRYTRRSDAEYYNIASYIRKIVSRKKGNYMVFFPSHIFLKNVYEIFESYFLDTAEMECVVQEEYMKEHSREAFLQKFQNRNRSEVIPIGELEEVIRMEIEEEETAEEDKTLIGFCVLGGIFSEGIDLKNDSLIGAIIVGTGLPMVCVEREILRNYFERQGGLGFDYAYRFPGMNKVLQAAGRVIRTVEDVGIVALLDDRFLLGTNQKLFPREWAGYKRCTLATIEDALDDFWEKYDLPAFE